MSDEQDPVLKALLGNPKLVRKSITALVLNAAAHSEKAESLADMVASRLDGSQEKLRKARKELDEQLAWNEELVKQKTLLRQVVLPGTRRH